MKSAKIVSLTLSLAFSFNLMAQSLEVNLGPSAKSEFDQLVVDSLNLRALAYQFAQEKQIEKSESIQLTREESNLLYDNALKYISLRSKLLNYIEPVKAKFSGLNDVEINTMLETQTYVFESSLDQANSQRREITYLNPNQELGRSQILQIQKALASTLLLMDNYIVGVMPFHKNKELDYLLNYDLEQRKVLSDISMGYSSPANRAMVVKAIKFFDSYLKSLNQLGLEISQEETQLHEVIQSSTWYHLVQNNQNESGISDGVATVWAALSRKSHRTLRIFSYGLSKGFGNLVGLVSSRKGLMTKLPIAEKNQIASEMQPLDILMEKTPFRLTDKMIPGHYGHVAIWIGNEQQLRELEVWDKIPTAVQEKIRNGHHIIEALRPGVEINTLEHFLNIDDMLVVRDRRQMSREYRQTAVLTAVAQIGKAYDFNFDVNTHERIVCSELAYVVFPDVKWPIAKSLGRYTISPDNVVELSINQDRTFEPVLLYYNGKRYHKELPYSVSLLLKAKTKYYVAFERFQEDR